VNNFAYVGPNRIVNLGLLAVAEWTGIGTGEVLRLRFAAPGFGGPQEVEVQEPYAGAVWNQIQPAAATGSPAPVPKPAPKPVQEPARERPRNAWAPPPTYGRGGSGSQPAAPTPTQARQGHGQNGNGNGNGNGFDGAPTTGKALFAWSKRIGKDLELDLVGWLTSWAREAGWPPRWIDWDRNDVAYALAQAQAWIEDQAEAETASFDTPTP
jgi:hypothetical protein